MYSHSATNPDTHHTHIALESIHPARRFPRGTRNVIGIGYGIGSLTEESGRPESLFDERDIVSFIITLN